MPWDTGVGKAPMPAGGTSASQRTLRCSFHPHAPTSTALCRPSSGENPQLSALSLCLCSWRGTRTWGRRSRLTSSALSRLCKAAGERPLRS